jgi:hypothetical protein
MLRKVSFILAAVAALAIPADAMAARGGGHGAGRRHHGDHAYARGAHHGGYHRGGYGYRGNAGYGYSDDAGYGSYGYGSYGYGSYGYGNFGGCIAAMGQDGKC